MIQALVQQSTINQLTRFQTKRARKKSCLSNRLFLPSLLLMTFFYLTGCGAPDTPQRVTEKFWQSISTQDFRRAEKLSMDHFLASGLKNLDITDFKIDSVRIKNYNAKINTSLWLNEPSQIREIQLITHLVQQDDQWLVDTMKTADSRIPGALHKLFNSLEEVKDSFIEALRKSANDMEDQIPEIENDLHNLGNELINNFDETLDEVLPKIESAVEKSLDEMNEALEELEQHDKKPSSNSSLSNNGNKAI